MNWLIYFIEYFLFFRIQFGLHSVIHYFWNSISESYLIGDFSQKIDRYEDIL